MIMGFMRGGGGALERAGSLSLVYPCPSPVSAATKNNDGWLTLFCQLIPAVISDR